MLRWFLCWHYWWLTIYLGVTIALKLFVADWLQGVTVFAVDWWQDVMIALTLFVGDWWWWGDYCVEISCGWLMTVGWWWLRWQYLWLTDDDGVMMIVLTIVVTDWWYLGHYCVESICGWLMRMGWWWLCWQYLWLTGDAWVIIVLKLFVVDWWRWGDDNCVDNICGWVMIVVWWLCWHYVWLLLLAFDWRVIYIRHTPGRAASCVLQCPTPPSLRHKCAVDIRWRCVVRSGL